MFASFALAGIKLRPAYQDDRPTLLGVHADAFGGAEGYQIAQLVGDLLVDETASPLLSLVAELDGGVVGHVLLTHASIDPDGQAGSARLLAPLAVKRGYQRQGIGRRLVEEALARLTRDGVKLVFVLGHPSYYPRFGFRPAGQVGLDAPFPIDPRNAEAWMVRELQPGVIGDVQGVVRCARSLNAPEHWVE